MNLQLYVESKFIVARRQGRPLPAGSSHLWTADPPPALPDALFEELGYYGALDEESSDTHPAAGIERDDDYDSLFAIFAEPVLDAIH